MHDRERVAVREAQRVERDRERFQRDLEAAEEETRREARLEALRMQVRIEAPTDPERLLRPTAARRYAEEAAKEERERAALLPVHAGAARGYDDATVVGDVRFKVMRALRDAGLEVRLLHGQEGRPCVVAMRNTTYTRLCDKVDCLFDKLVGPCDKL